MPQNQNRQILKNCEICASPFMVKIYRAQSARFCSGSCRAKWVSALPNSLSSQLRGKPCERMKGNKLRLGLKPTHSFSKGHEPWNKNLKGIHLSPSSEFKSGPRPDKRAEIGEVRIRKCRGSEMRAFVKIEHPNQWKLRAVKVWEDLNGPVPKGSVVHHDDRNALNDSPSNLLCLTRAEHLAEHRSEFS